MKILNFIFCGLQLFFGFSAPSRVILAGHPFSRSGDAGGCPGFLGPAGLKLNKIPGRGED